MNDDDPARRRSRTRRTPRSTLRRGPARFPILVLAAALVTAAALAPAALAAHGADDAAYPRGPAPGYDDPYAYQQDHAVGEADNASADPAGYAAGHADAPTVQATAAHTLWWSCWVADHEGDNDLAGACDAYYVPPGEASAANQTQEDDGQEDQNRTATEEALNATQATAANVTDDLRNTTDEVLDAVNDTAADPATAVQQVERVLAAALGFVGRTVQTVLTLVHDLLGGGLHAAAAGTEAVADGVVAIADGVVGVANGLAGGIVAVVGGTTGTVHAGALATADGLLAAASTLSEGIGSAAAAAADGTRAAATAAVAVPVGAADAAADTTAAGVHGTASIGARLASGVTTAMGDALDGSVRWFHGLLDGFDGGPARPAASGGDGALDGVDVGGQGGLLDDVQDTVDPTAEGDL